MKKFCMIFLVVILTIIASVTVASAKETTKAVKLTYYCACPSCNGSWALWRNGTWSTTTTSGKRLYNLKHYKYKYCAATPSVGRIGQTIKVKLNGKTYKLKIVDRMGSSYGNRIDIFYPSHAGCYKLGVKYNHKVQVI